MSLSLAAASTLVVGSNILPHAIGTPDSIISSCVSAGESIQSFVAGFGDLVKGENGDGLVAAYVATAWIGLVTVAYSEFLEQSSCRIAVALSPSLDSIVYL